jgi:SAM-dependent methyltransferase
MARTESRGRRDFWTDRKVAWYRRANERSDYAARVLEVITPLLVGARTALDVGAGFGALTVPLARRLEHVTALEPSPAMARALRDETGRRGLDNVTVVEAAWGTVPVEPHDVLVCAHVGPLLGRDAPFLREAPALARHAVALVRDVPDDGHKFFFDELYPRLLGQPYDRCCDYADTLAELARLGIAPTVTTIAYASDQPFDTLEEACDFWMEYMNLTGDTHRATIREFLAGRLRRVGHEWIAPLQKRAAVIEWRVGGRDTAAVRAAASPGEPEASRLRGERDTAAVRAAAGPGEPEASRLRGERDTGEGRS